MFNKKIKKNTNLLILGLEDGIENEENNKISDDLNRKTLQNDYIVKL